VEFKIIHKDANKVIRYMKELGIDKDIQERVYLALWTEKKWVEKPYGHKTTVDKHIETL